MNLQDIIKLIEKDKGIGIFSKSNKTIGDGHTYKIPFASKPAQQVLAALGASIEEHSTPLLTASGSVKITGNDHVIVNSFMPKVAESTLTLDGSRIDRLFKSAKIYVDTSKIPAGEYKKALLSNTPLDYLATSVCHAQEIDLLVDTVTSSTGRAHTTVRRSGTVNEKAPAILLLSSAKLNLNDYSKNKDDQLRLIKDMYRNLFQATLSEEREYIAMPATGLGRSNGNPSLYFTALMAAAKEFPALKIIYNPGKYAKEFDEALKESQLLNVVRTTKNILFVAANLINQDVPKQCAVHNPSSPEVLYGLADVGGHWKSSSKLGDLLHGEESRTFQTYIGTVTTAAINSYGINPGAYSNIMERNLDKTTNPAIIDVEMDDSPLKPPVLRVDSDDESIMQPANVLPPSPSTRLSSFFQTELEDITLEVIERQEPDNPSLFDEEQRLEIECTINQLVREIRSSWPYPNKDLKQIKVNALTKLLSMPDTMNVSDAIATIKNEYPRVTDGRISTRTAQLLDKLERNDSGYVMV